MKKSILFSVAALLLAGVYLSSCSKEKKFMDKAILTGLDTGTCSCCGGVMITFSDNAAPYSADYKLLENNPEDMGIKQGTQFPIYVELDWVDADKCSGKYIRMKQMKIIQ